MQAKNDKTKVDFQIRLCNKKDESVTRMVSECKILALEEYKKWHGSQRG